MHSVFLIRYFLFETLPSFHFGNSVTHLRQFDLQLLLHSRVCMQSRLTFYINLFIFLLQSLNYFISEVRYTIIYGMDYKRLRYQSNACWLLTNQITKIQLSKVHDFQVPTIIIRPERTKENRFHILSAELCWATIQKLYFEIQKRSSVSFE